MGLFQALELSPAVEACAASLSASQSNAALANSSTGFCHVNFRASQERPVSAGSGNLDCCRPALFHAYQYGSDFLLYCCAMDPAKNQVQPDINKRAVEFLHFVFSDLVDKEREYR